MYHMHLQLSHIVECPAQTDAGLKVLLFTTMFLFSFPLCFLASSVSLSRRWTPSYASWAGDAWLIWMWWQGEGSVSGFYRGWRWRRVRTQQAVLGDCVWLLPFCFVVRTPGGVLLGSTCSPRTPLWLSWTITQCQAECLHRLALRQTCGGQQGW